MPLSFVVLIVAILARLCAAAISRVIIDAPLRDTCAPGFRKDPAGHCRAVITVPPSTRNLLDEGIVKSKLYPYVRHQRNILWMPRVQRAFGKQESPPAMPPRRRIIFIWEIQNSKEIKEIVQ